MFFFFFSNVIKILFIFRSRCYVFEEFILNWEDRLKEQDPTVMTVKLQKDVNIFKVVLLNKRLT